MSELPLPYPLEQRPRLGSRLTIRNYTRRYLKAIYKEMSDWKEENQEKASKLLMYCIAYTEDYVTQHLDHMMMALYKVVLKKDNLMLRENVPVSLKLIGRFV